MDQNYLQQLIGEVKARDGGLILNMDGKPEAVVLSIEKYNQLISNNQFAVTSPQAQDPAASILFQTKTVLVTGGAGYVGAHVVRHLLNAGHRVIILDNLSTGKRDNLPQEAKFFEGDAGDQGLLRDIFATEKVYAVMHLAASIEVEESVQEPIKYLENNALNTAKLLEVMDEAEVKNIIFSSTAAVYGEQAQQPISETATRNPNNPYGRSKALAEDIIKYFCEHRQFNAVTFRYFNACGSDFDGKLHFTHDSHLLAKLMQIVLGLESELTVNGSDYETHDGTCVRDYVHVLDIAAAHLLALENLERLAGWNLYNLGTGRGFSVLEMVNGASEILNKMIPMSLGPKRAGDAAAAVADASKIKSDLGFVTQFSDLATIVKTAFLASQNQL